MSTGGSLMMRRCPSTSSESFDKACKLSRVFAFARALPACVTNLRSCFVLALAPTADRIWSAGRRAYQTSIVPISANSAIAFR